MIVGQELSYVGTRKGQPNYLTFVRQDAPAGSAPEASAPAAAAPAADSGPAAAPSGGGGGGGKGQGTDRTWKFFWKILCTFCTIY